METTYFIRENREWPKRKNYSSLFRSKIATSQTAEGKNETVSFLGKKGKFQIRAVYINSKGSDIWDMEYCTRWDMSTK